MSRTEASAIYGAALKNFACSVAAINNRGELVLSLWKQYFKPGDGLITYIDKASRWTGHGNKEFRLYLDSAFKNSQIIRAVIGRTSDEVAAASRVDAHPLDNTFYPARKK